MNGTIAVLVSRELFDSWNPDIAETVRDVAKEGATGAGGRLLAGDPEFVIPDRDGDPILLHYRMVK